MKTLLKKFGILFLFSMILFSCRSEDMEIVEAPEKTTGINSTVANLLLRTATNDGSYDNILDGASCFNIKLPVTVIANGIEVVIETEDDIDIVEDIFDEFTDDIDTLEIIFPITIILDDYTEVRINSQAELNAAALNCSSDSSDDDIECIDIQYPITASIFNLNNELIETVIINNDEELFDLLDDIDEDIIISFDFPITVILADGTIIQIENFIELENVITNAIDTCDEDDDNDANDDDCDNCTVQQLTDVLTSCDNWMVDSFERDDTDLEDVYVGYLFNFDTAGVLTVAYNGMSYNGTWSASGEGNSIIVAINIPELSDFNDRWNLHEIEVDDSTEIDLRLGDDRLSFESDCNSGGGEDDTALVTALTTGDWYVNYYFEDTDETADFEDFVFNFATNNTATATNTNGTTNGTWSTSSGDETDLELNLNFGTSFPLEELAEDWDVLEVTNDIIRLKDVSGSDGSVEFLTFGRDPFSGGGGGQTDLGDFLDDGLWFVASYIDDGDNETGDYAGYTIDFNVINGTVIATNGSTTNTGIWEVLNSGNKLMLDFGEEIPFDEFNDDWDVLSASETEVILQDISGGGGGTDTLTLQKL